MGEDARGTGSAGAWSANAVAAVHSDDVESRRECADSDFESRREVADSERDYDSVWSDEQVVDAGSPHRQQSAPELDVAQFETGHLCDYSAPDRSHVETFSPLELVLQIKAPEETIGEDLCGSEGDIDHEQELNTLNLHSFETQSSRLTNSSTDASHLHNLLLRGNDDAIVTPHSQIVASTQSEMGTRRWLRVRRPEQKNPYTFDYLIHRAQFSRIGLKPLKLTHTVRSQDFDHDLFSQMDLSEDDDGQTDVDNHNRHVTHKKNTATIKHCAESKLGSKHVTNRFMDPARRRFLNSRTRVGSKDSKQPVIFMPNEDEIELANLGPEEELTDAVFNRPSSSESSERDLDDNLATVNTTSVMKYRHSRRRVLSPSPKKLISALRNKQSHRSFSHVAANKMVQRVIKQMHLSKGYARVRHKLHTATTKSNSNRYSRDLVNKVKIKRTPRQSKLPIIRQTIENHDETHVGLDEANASTSTQVSWNCNSRTIVNTLKQNKLDNYALDDVSFEIDFGILIPNHNAKIEDFFFTRKILSSVLHLHNKNLSGFRDVTYVINDTTWTLSESPNSIVSKLETIASNLWTSNAKHDASPFKFSDDASRLIEFLVQYATSTRLDADVSREYFTNSLVTLITSPYHTKLIDQRASFGKFILGLILTIYLEQSHEKDMARRHILQEALSHGILDLLQILNSVSFPKIKRFINCISLTQSDAENNDNEIADCWVAINNLYPFTNDVNANIHGLNIWFPFNKVIDISGNIEALSDVRELHHFSESVWTKLMQISSLLLFDENGVVSKSSISGNWDLVRTLVNVAIEKFHRLDKGFNRVYLISLLARCQNLLFRKWDNANEGVLLWYSYFSGLRLQNLRGETYSCLIPNYLLDFQESTLQINATEDSGFNAFIKLVVTAIRSYTDASCAFNPKSLRVVASMIGKITPQRSYPSITYLSLQEIACLQNHIYLIIALYFSAPQQVRPPLEIIDAILQDVKRDSGVRRIHANAWCILMKYHILHNEQLTYLLSWSNKLFKECLDEYRLLQKEFRIENKEIGQTQMYFKPLSRAAHSLEEDTLNLFRNLTSILDLPLEKHNFHLIADIVRGSEFLRYLNNSSRTPEKIVLQTVQVVKCILGLGFEHRKRLSNQEIIGQTSDESHIVDEFGDISALYQLASTDDSHYEFIHFIEQDMSPVCYQLVADLLDDTRVCSDEVIQQAADNWFDITKFLIESGSRDLSDYLNEWQGKESWFRLADSRKKLKWLPRMLSKFLIDIPQSWESYRQLFLLKWMQSLIVRDYCYQHVLTTAVINSEPKNILFANLPFVLSSNNTYDIDCSTLQITRKQLLSSLVGQMARHCAAGQSLYPSAPYHASKEYTLYLDGIFQALLTCYERSKNNELDRRFYIDTAHFLVNEILQYWAYSDSNENIPRISWFLDPVNFPQPRDVNSLGYASARLRGYARSGVEKSSVKQLIKSFITVHLKDAIVEGHEQAFVTLCCSSIQKENLSKCESSSSIMGLRKFLWHEIFTSLILKASRAELKMHDLQWYVTLPILYALRQTIATTFVSLDNNQILDLDEFNHSLTLILPHLVALLKHTNTLVNQECHLLKLAMLGRFCDLGILINHISQCLASDITRNKCENLQIQCYEFINLLTLVLEAGDTLLQDQPDTISQSNYLIQFERVAHFMGVCRLRSQWSWSRRGREETIYLPSLRLSDSMIEQTFQVARSQFFFARESSDCTSDDAQEDELVFVY